MGCNCAKNKRQYEVVTEGGNGKVVYQHSQEPVAQGVAKRYPGSIVREKPASATATTRR